MRWGESKIFYVFLSWDFDSVQESVQGIFELILSFFQFFQILYSLLPVFGFWVKP